jgi:hypothetical protein
VCRTPPLARRSEARRRGGAVAFRNINPGGSSPESEDNIVNDDELDRVDVRRRAVMGAAAAASALGALSMTTAAQAAAHQGLSLNGGLSDVESRAESIRRDQPEAAAMLSTLASSLRGRQGINKISFGLNIKW